MGFDTDIVAGFALEADAEGPSQEQALVPVRTWAALAQNGRILVSVEQLAGGANVDYVLAHETIHDVLLHTSQYGTAQLALSAFNSPPWPPGLMARDSLRVLANLVDASRRTQEACATLVPAAQIPSQRRGDYWAQVPAPYRDLVADLRRIVDLDLPQDIAKRLLLALGQYALGYPPPLATLLDPRATRQHLRVPQHHPDVRFERAAAAIRDLAVSELETLATAPDSSAAIAQRAGLNDPEFADFTATPPHPDWIRVWQERIWGLVCAWRQDSRLTENERAFLPDSPEACLLLLPTPTPTVLKAGLTNTVSAKMRRLAQPAMDDLTRYPLVFLRYNCGPGMVPAFDAVDAVNAPQLGPEECSLWLHSPTEAAAAGVVLTTTGLVDYLAAVPETVTVCVSDLSYLFSRGDVIYSRPILAGRRHLVVLQHQSLGALLSGPLLAGGLAGETHLTVTVWDGKTPGVGYLLIRPSVARFPVVVAPAPWPTAALANNHIEQFHDSLTWDLVRGDRFLEEDVLGQADLLRYCMWFENQPWPEPFGWTSPTAQLAGGLRVAEPERFELELGPAPDSRGGGGNAIDRLPPSTRAMLDRIGAFEARGQTRKAVRLYARAMSNGTDTDRTAAGIALGMLQMSRGRLAEAEQAYSQAAQRIGTDLRALALLYLADLLIGTFREEEAAVCLLAAVRTASADHAPPAAFRLAQLLQPRGDQPTRSLLQWVVNSGHPDVAPLAAEALRHIET
jgi:hypothetical protein